jgi:hypothetical protein
VSLSFLLDLFCCLIVAYLIRDLGEAFWIDIGSQVKLVVVNGLQALKRCCDLILRVGLLDLSFCVSGIDGEVTGLSVVFLFGSNIYCDFHIANRA